MIIKNKNNTIDLRAIIAQDYLNSKKTVLEKILIKYVSIIGIILYILISLGAWSGLITISNTNASEIKKISIRDRIRLERLAVCQKAYKKSGINKQFIYKQIPAIRCATYMGLVYAYESNFGKSRKCMQDKNCWGIKGNGIEYPNGFIKFNSYKQGREYFAKKYFKYHYKKKINQFVYNWSMTDRKTYINFMRKKYFKMYKELEYLYFTGLY